MDYMKYGTFGAVAGLATGWLLKTVSTVVTGVSGGAVTLDLQSVSVSTTGLGGVINTGLGDYAKKLLGGLPIAGMDWLYLALGGALFVILGAWIVENVKQLQFAKSREGKLTTVFVVAGIVSGWILSMSVSIPALNVIIVSVVNAYLLAWGLLAADKALKLNLAP